MTHHKHWIIKPDSYYYNRKEIRYYSTRYNKAVVVPYDFKSDGATGARDINSCAWWVHDVLCESGEFLDGSKCTNWQASSILSDILKSEGRWFRARSWFIATLIWGCIRKISIEINLIKE